MVVVNTKPIAVDDFLVFDEHAVISGNLLSNDYDPDGSAVYLRFFDNIRVDAKKGLAQETVIQGDYGFFKLHPNGSFSYELDHTLDAVKNLAAGHSLVEKVNYKISDGGGATDVGLLHLTINGVDDYDPTPERLTIDFEDIPVGVAFGVATNPRSDAIIATGDPTIREMDDVFGDRGQDANHVLALAVGQSLHITPVDYQQAPLPADISFDAAGAFGTTSQLVVSTTAGDYTINMAFLKATQHFEFKDVTSLTVQGSENAMVIDNLVLDWGI